MVICGLNPGQDSTKNPTHESNPFLAKSIDDFGGGQRDLITKQKWLLPSGKPYRLGEAPYKIRISSLRDYIGHPHALVTNLIFIQTQREVNLPLGEEGRSLRDACWEVHQNILDITQAEVIIALGCTAFNEFKRRLHGSDPVEKRESGHGKWVCRRTYGSWKGKQLTIFGLPHLSSYKIDRYPSVLHWVAESISKG